jgi:activating signal cointegrator 1
MKALTLLQPYATLVSAGAKRIETRSWPTWYRGPLAIHSSSRFPGWCRDLIRDEPFASTFSRLIGHGTMMGIGSPRFEILPQGRVVCTCRLVDCYEITADNAPPEPERSFGDYTPGRFAWILEDVKPLPRPSERIRGRLGLWNLPEGVIEL